MARYIIELDAEDEKEIRDLEAKAFALTVDDSGVTSEHAMALMMLVTQLKDKLLADSDQACIACGEVLRKVNYEGYYDNFAIRLCGCDRHDGAEVVRGSQA